MFAMNSRAFSPLIGIALLVIVAPSCRTIDAPTASEPDDALHPDLNWLQERKVRGIWIGGDLDDPFGDSDKTKGRVLADAGFNLVVLYTGVDRNDRERSPHLADRLRRNLAVARQHGLKLLAKWQYGSTHLEPYRKYREGGGKFHETTCCPLDAGYVDRHVGRWAVECARLGADGFVFDTEMYESDTTTYPGPCFCDDCFRQYLEDHDLAIRGHMPEHPGNWINNRGQAETYNRYQTGRVEDLYDRIRARCQAINPAFLLGYAPFLDSFAGLTRGLGTPHNPCLVFSEQEYTNGPSPQTLANVQRIRTDRIPAIYLSGLMIQHQDPDMLAGNALRGALYGDGWWAWYGTALMTQVGTDEPDAYKSPYGRVKGTTAIEYHDRLTETHARLDALIGTDPNQWPKMPAVPAPPQVEVPRRRGEISVDGELDEPAWQRAARVTMPTTRFGEVATRDTAVRVCWDAAALYVAFEAQMPEGETTVNVPQRGRDNTAIWQFDGVEIFIAPDRSTRRYAQFMVSALADVTDLLVDIDGGTGKYGSPSWNADVSAAAMHGGGRYVVEVRIPFEPLARPPAAGDFWGANFYRFSPDGAAWSPTYGGFHSPARFGTLQFSDE
ncbi:MAG: hypothetical protein CMJ18_06710 [Phycisphaeraceae bacterium]|nr:hypothetical protein [Phycisphaeraceae bacterium]